MFVDDYSRHIMVYPMRDKDELELQYARYEQDMSEYFLSQRRQLHTDNGGEFLNKSLASYLTDKEIKHTTSSPYSPNQNTIAEQAMWRLCSIGRALLLDSGLPVCHWAMALTQAAIRLNFTPRRWIRFKPAAAKAGDAAEDKAAADKEANSEATADAQKGKKPQGAKKRLAPDEIFWTTPYQRLKGRKPNVRFLRVFGARAWVLNEPIKGRAKMESIATEGWCIGPARYSRGMIVYIPNNDCPNDLTQGKYKISRNVRVDESLVPKGRTGEGPSLTTPTVGGGERPAATDVIIFRVPKKAKQGHVLEVISPKTKKGVQVRVTQNMHPDTYWSVYDTTVPYEGDAVLGTSQSAIDASADGADTDVAAAPPSGLSTEGVLVGGNKKQLQKIPSSLRMSCPHMVH